MAVSPRVLLIAALAHAVTLAHAHGHGPPMGHGHGVPHSGFHGGHGHNPFHPPAAGRGGSFSGPPHHQPMLWFSVIFAVGAFLYLKYFVGFKGSELAAKKQR